jgi:hypothetical protein
MTLAVWLWTDLALLAGRAALVALAIHAAAGTYRTVAPRLQRPDRLRLTDQQRHRILKENDRAHR